MEVQNEVVLRGRISAEGETRVLPSGDELVTFRVVVERPSGHAGRQRVDALECVAWSGRARRSVVRWRAGDVVRVEGALRRRFFRGSSGPQSRVEVEMTSGRLIRRAASA